MVGLPVVVAIHGSASTPSSWVAVHAALRDRLGHVEFVAPAVPGCEQDIPGAVPDLSFDEIVDALVAQVQPAQRPIVLVGFSSGALFGLHLAKRACWNLQAVLLLEPMVVPLLRFAGYHAEYETLNAVFERAVDAVDAGNPDASEEILDAWLGPGAYASSSPRMKDHFRVWAPLNAAHIRAVAAKTFAADDLTDIEAPVSATYGLAAPSLWRAFADSAARAVPNGMTVGIEGGTHALLATHPNLVAELIAERLS